MALVTLSHEAEPGEVHISNGTEHPILDLMICRALAQTARSTGTKFSTCI